MRERYLKDLELMNLDLLKMCGKVVSQITDSVEALRSGDEELARKVVIDDEIVDDMAMRLEDKCLQMLLRQQPVATDFRHISAILKMVTDIERIGDHAEDIADLIFTLHDKSAKNIKYIAEMCELAKKMVSESVDGFIKEDLTRARQVPGMDDELDELFLQTKKVLATALHKELYQCDDIITLLMIAKYLERIGDHAVNLSEWTVYYEQGVRVKEKSLKPKNK